MSYYSDYKNGVIINILLQPSASQTQIQGVHDDYLKVQTTASPVEGQANRALIKFLSKIFDVPKTSISIVKGETSRRKQVLIGRLTIEEAQKILQLADGQ